MDSRPLNDFIVHLLAHSLAEESFSSMSSPQSGFDWKDFL
jgi:hypothetical protein